VYRCEPCSKRFQSFEQLDQHKKTKKHRKNEKEVADSDSSLFGSRNEVSFGHGKKENEAAQLRGQRNPDTLDNLSICLFCNRVAMCSKNNLDHMRNAHSFALLEPEHLISFDGLLSHLAHKIHIEFLCLICDKSFGDGGSTQKHMIDKGHCFMDPTKFPTDYSKFYNFKFRAYHPNQDLSTPKKEDPEFHWEEVKQADFAEDGSSSFTTAKEPQMSQPFTVISDGHFGVESLHSTPV